MSVICELLPPTEHKHRGSKSQGECMCWTSRPGANADMEKASTGTTIQHNIVKGSGKKAVDMCCREHIWKTIVETRLVIFLDMNVILKLKIGQT